jgi:hypothetical protein
VTLSVTVVSPSIAYNEPAMRRMICIALFGALLAGCGGGGPTTPSSGTARPQNLVSAAYRYAACMREHGVPGFPDPQVVNHGGETGIRQVVSAAAAAAPAFQAAQKACARIMPGSQNATQNAQQRHARVLGLLSFARCMRSRGVSDFPDPSTQGQIDQQTLASAGIDIHLPSVIRAAMTCAPASHGAVTRAAVAQATSGGG